MVPHASGIAWICAASAALLLSAFFAVRSFARKMADLEAQAAEQSERLADQMTQHRRALDALADGLKSAIFVCDGKGMVLYANRTARDWFRLEQPSGRSILAATISYELEQLVLAAAAGEEPSEQEISITYPEDRALIVRSWREPDGDRVFVSLYDLTELRRLERVRQDFVANVSHELRTPLAAIRAMAETLLDEPKASLEKRNEYLGRITGEVDRLATIVSDLLVLSAAEMNPVRKQACDLATAIRSMLGLLEAKARAKGLEIRHEIPVELVVEANPNQMNQVFINLIDNAINYTPSGSINILLQKDGKWAVFRIKDTGLGIPSEDQPRIFERFYRVDKGRSRATGGTGLGLSIVKHIVEVHGGTIEVESALNEGTSFTVRLPIGRPKA